MTTPTNGAAAAAAPLKMRVKEKHRKLAAGKEPARTCYQQTWASGHRHTMPEEIGPSTDCALTRRRPGSQHHATASDVQVFTGRVSNRRYQILLASDMVSHQRLISRLHTSISRWWWPAISTTAVCVRWPVAMAAVPLPQTEPLTY